MKEFVEKLIEQLREKAFIMQCADNKFHKFINIDKLEKIVNQLAEEYKDCVKMCSKDCEVYDKEKHYCPKFCKVIRETVEELKENHNQGWILCSERLPEVEADVLLSLRSLDVYTGFRANTKGCFYVEGEGYVEFENVLAWQPLPEPYKP